MIEFTYHRLVTGPNGLLGGLRSVLMITVGSCVGMGKPAGQEWVGLQGSDPTVA